MDIIMIILCILHLCGCLSGTALAIYGIVFACVVALDAILRKMRGD